MLSTIYRLIFAVLISGVVSTIANAQATTADVWNHHIAAWEARDVEAIASDYTEESVLILNSKVFSGQEAIKKVFVQLFGIFDAGNNRIDTPVLNGRIVYITWHFSPTGDSEFFGTDTFVIENGKIAVQTISSPLYDKYPVIELRD